MKCFSVIGCKAILRLTYSVLFTVSCFISFGQNEQDNSKIAFDYYYNKQYDSALVFYQKIEQTEGGKAPAYLLNQIGNCYNHLGETQQAKKYYRTCTVDKNAEGVFPPERDCCLHLSDIYQNESKFDSALYYLQLAEEHWPHTRICSAGEFERILQLNYTFARCFKEVGQIDSAISRLTPVIFIKYETIENSFKAKDFKKMVGFYEELLHIKYTQEEIEVELQRGIDELVYIHKQDKLSKLRNPKEDWYNLNCYTELFGEKVVLVEFGYEANSWSEESIGRYDKDKLVKKLKSTEVYLVLTN